MSYQAVISTRFKMLFGDSTRRADLRDDAESWRISLLEHRSHQVERKFAAKNQEAQHWR